MRPPALIRGPSAKPQVNALGAVAAGGDLQQRVDPRPRAPGHHPQALRHQRPVEAGERHHVADGRQRHQVEQAHQVGRRTRAEPAVAAKLAHQGDAGQEGERRSTDGAQAGAAARLVRVHRGQDRRRRPVALVVVEHDDLGAAGQVRQRAGGGGAAIDADDQRRPARRQPVQRRRVRAVALQHPVRDVGVHDAAQLAQQPGDDRGGAGAVHVVVAEHADGLGRRDRARQPGGGDVHVGQAGRVGQQRPQRRLQEVRGAVDPVSARRQQAPDHLRQLQALRQRLRHALVAGILRVGAGPGPAPAGQAARDPQHRLPRRRGGPGERAVRRHAQAPGRWGARWLSSGSRSWSGSCGGPR